jgi:hypothetical protein
LFYHLEKACSAGAFYPMREFKMKRLMSYSTSSPTFQCNKMQRFPQNAAEARAVLAVLSRSFSLCAPYSLSVLLLVRSSTTHSNQDPVWLLACSVAPHGVAEALKLAQFNREERLQWNKTSGYGNSMDEAVPPPPPAKEQSMPVVVAQRTPLNPAQNTGSSDPETSKHIEDTETSKHIDDPETSKHIEKAGSGCSAKHSKTEAETFMAAEKDMEDARAKLDDVKSIGRIISGDPYVFTVLVVRFFLYWFLSKLFCRNELGTTRSC